MKKIDNYLEYKGYHTRIEFDYDSCSLFGVIEGINDFVVFESEDATKIEQEFHDAVDDYLQLCEELGKTPEKEYKGVFNVRVSPETHRALSVIAFRTGRTLNSVAEEALETYVNSESAQISGLMYAVSTYKPTSDNSFILSELNSNSSYYSTEGVS